MLAIISFPEAFFSQDLSPGPPQALNPFATARCTLHTAHCTMQTIHCIQCTMCIAHSIPCTLHLAQRTQCAVYKVQVIWIAHQAWAHQHCTLTPPLSANRLLPKDQYSERTPLLKVIPLVIRILITLYTLCNPVFKMRANFLLIHQCVSGCLDV